MQFIMSIISTVQHFIHSDTKAEIVYSIVTGASVAGIKAHIDGTPVIPKEVIQQSLPLYHELMIRDVNTILIGLFTGILTFFVTMWLRKFYPHKK